MADSPAIDQLERLRRSLVGEGGRPRDPLSRDEFRLTRAVLDTLGIGLEPVHVHLYQALPSADEFRAWAEAEVGGRFDPARLARADEIAAGARSPATRTDQEALAAQLPVLTDDDLAQWDEDGYVIVREAAPEHGRAALEQAIWDRLAASPEDPSSWYGRALQQAIMLPLFRAPGIDEIHAAPRIRRAFAQLLGTADLVMTADRCGFNAPLRPGEPWGGAGLHLDLDSFAPPVGDDVQGVLYLTDTPAEQGAFRCVPGFHTRIDAFLGGRGGLAPASEELEALGSVSVPADAGDLIIWRSALPHGPQPNRGQRPRLVHYLTMYPTPRPAGVPA
jgi:hypothetical protein